MKFFLDLEEVAPHLYERLGLIEVSEAVFDDAAFHVTENPPREFSDNDPPMKVLSLPSPERAKPESSMDRVHRTGREFFEALAEWDGEEEQGEIICRLLGQNATPESRAMLAFQVLLAGVANPTGGFADFTTEGKLFAINFAETIGPDHAQTLYHFAKLVTKLA